MIPGPCCHIETLFELEYSVSRPKYPYKKKSIKKTGEIWNYYAFAKIKKITASSTESRTKYNDIR